MDKLQMALNYIKDLNMQLWKQLDQSEKQIKNKILEKTSTISEHYKAHLIKKQGDMDLEMQQKMQMIKML